jgi:O-antigen/teichoic acid export membrane protein
MLDNVRRLSRQLAAYGTADVAVLAVNVLLLPLYTRVLSTTEYGALALLLVCEALLKVVFRWGLDTSFLRLYYDCKTDEAKQTLAGTLAIAMAAVNTLLTAALLASAGFVNQWLFESDAFVSAYRLLVLNSLAGAFLFLPFNLLRIQERARLFASLTFLRALGTIVGRLVLVVGFRMGVLGLVLADVLVTVTLYLVMSGTIRSMMALRFSPAVLREAIGYGFPQVPHGLLSQTQSAADRFLLGLYMPLSQVGVYLIGHTIAGMIKFFPVAFEAAWMPFAFDSMQRRDARELYARMATYAGTVLIFLALGVTALAGPMVTLVLPAAYQDTTPLVPVLVAGMTIQAVAWFLATSLNIAKQTRVYPLITAVGAVTSVAANVVLIPRYGMYGAAVAFVVSQAAATAVTAWFAQRAYRIPYEAARLAQILVVGAATGAATLIVTAGEAWQTLVIRTALLALFPLGLYAVRFFEPHELSQVRAWVASMLAADLKARPG